MCLHLSEGRKKKATSKSKGNYLFYDDDDSQLFLNTLVVTSYLVWTLQAPLMHNSCVNINDKCV